MWIWEELCARVTFLSGSPWTPSSVTFQLLIFVPKSWKRSKTKDGVPSRQSRFSDQVSITSPVQQKKFFFYFNNNNNNNNNKNFVKLRATLTRLKLKSPKLKLNSCLFLLLEPSDRTEIISNRPTLERVQMKVLFNHVITKDWFITSHLWNGSGFDTSQQIKKRPSTNSFEFEWKERNDPTDPQSTHLQIESSSGFIEFNSSIRETTSTWIHVKWLKCLKTV